MVPDQWDSLAALEVGWGWGVLSSPVKPVWVGTSVSSLKGAPSRLLVDRSHSGPAGGLLRQHHLHLLVYS